MSSFNLSDWQQSAPNPGQTFIGAFNAAQKQAQANRAEQEKKKLAGEMQGAIEAGDWRKVASIAARAGADPDEILKYAGAQPKQEMELDEHERKTFAPFAHQFGQIQDPEARRQYIRMNRSKMVALGADPATLDAIEANPTSPEVEAYIRAHAEHGYTAKERDDHTVADRNSRYQKMGEGETIYDVEQGAPVYGTPKEDQDHINPGINDPRTGGVNPASAMPPEGSVPGYGGGYVGGTDRGSAEVWEGVVAKNETPNQSDYQSNGKPWVSPKGAMYKMQVMPATARDPGYGVQGIRNNSPEEYNRVGRDYLGAMRQKYQDDPRKVLAAYNAGPGRVDALIARYGDDWLRYAPAETRDYVAKGLVNLGATQYAGTPADANAGGGDMPNEARAAGGWVSKQRPQKAQPSWQDYQNPNDPQGMYQREATTGQIRKVSSGPKQAAGKPLPTKYHEKYAKSVGEYESYERLNKGFQDDYAGVGAGIENTVQKYTGMGTKGQNQWWADQKALDNNIRNGLFGASLTEGEKKAFLDTSVTPDMTPSEIRANLKRRQEILDGALAREQRALIAAGYNKDEIKELSGGRVYGKPSGGNSAALAKARDAIRRGAPRDAVIARLRQAGIDPAGL